jgi:hypothetical protein
MAYRVGFNPATMECAPLVGKPLPDGVQFSRVTAGQAYSWAGVTVSQLDIVTENETPVADFSSLLPSGFKPTWRSVGGLGGQDLVFAAAYSDTGAQGTGTYVCAYNRRAGYFLLDTQKAGVPPFTIHNVKICRSGQFMLVTPSGLAFSYIWEVGTKKLFQFTGGHSAHGLARFVIGTNSPMGQHEVRPYVTPASGTPLLSAFPQGIAPPLDNHESWANCQNDTQPFIVVTTDNGTHAAQPFPAAWYNEVNAIATDGSGSRWRFCHTYSSGKSPYFSTAAAIGSVSQDGRFFMFCSDWMGTLGNDDKGNPRSDCFIAELL